MNTRFSTFLFKFFNNTLGLNSRVSHFNNNVNRNCTFCSLINAQNDETFIHLFLLCDTTQRWHSRFLDEHTRNILLLNEVDRKRFWLLGEVPGDTYYGKLLRLGILLFQFTIWECKLNKLNSLFITLREKYCDSLYILVNSKRKWKDQFYSQNFPLCRY